MTNKMKLELLEDWVWNILKKRNVLGHEWSRTTAEMRDASSRFIAGNYVAIEFTYIVQLWMHVWIAHEVKGGTMPREFDESPKSIKLKWSKSARETAHNIAAVIEMITEAIECCNTYRIAGESRLRWKEVNN